MKRLLPAVLLAAACGQPADENQGFKDLPLGDQLADDKADGNWGAALTCKAAPNLPRTS